MTSVPRAHRSSPGSGRPARGTNAAYSHRNVVAAAGTHRDAAGARARGRSSTRSGEPSRRLLSAIVDHKPERPCRVSCVQQLPAAERTLQPEAWPDRGRGSGIRTLPVIAPDSGVGPDLRESAGNRRAARAVLRGGSTGICGALSAGRASRTPVLHNGYWDLPPRHDRDVERAADLVVGDGDSEG